MVRTSPAPLDLDALAELVAIALVVRWSRTWWFAEREPRRVAYRGGGGT